MKRLCLVTAVALAAAPATAAPGKTIVLQSEGRADAATRAKLDASLVKLASAGGAQVLPGETTFTETATAVGCAPETPACRDEVLGMLGVDELVYATMTPRPGGHEVTVYRVARGATRDTKIFVATGRPTEQLGDIASLFGVTAAPVTTPGADAPLETTPITEPEAAPLLPETEPVAPVVATGPLSPATQPIDAGPSRRRTQLQIAGMAGGGAMVLVGFLLWGEAGTIQEDIDVHPTATREQLQALAELERRGDGYATWGNVMFLGGAVLGGVSTYLYLKDRKARSATHTARIAPTVMGSGAGLTLTLGGSR